VYRLSSALFSIEKISEPTIPCLSSWYSRAFGLYYKLEGWRHTSF
jgi:hypothetical protein